MSDKIHPAVAIVLAIIVIVVVGLFSMKKFGTPDGIQGKIPASAANPNGGGPPQPAGLGGAGSAGAPQPNMGGAPHS